MELNSGLEEREEETNILTGQVRGNISKDSENPFPDFSLPKDMLKLLTITGGESNRGAGGG